MYGKSIDRSSQGRGVHFTVTNACVIDELTHFFHDKFSTQTYRMSLFDVCGYQCRLINIVPISIHCINVRKYHF